MLEDGFTFLNHGAFGAALRSAMESKHRWAEYIERQPVRFLDRELLPLVVHVVRGLADVLDARPEDLLPMPSATTAINTVLRSWQRQFKPGPQHRLLSYSVSYGSTKKLLRKISEECGAQLDEAVVDFPLADEGPVLDTLAAALRPETALVVLDAVPSNAPFVLPLEEAVALCRERAPDAFIVVDAAHGLGFLPLNLRKSPADALLTNCHKWFSAPKGTAVLHVPVEHQSWIEPLVISHGFGADFVSGFYWTGLADYSSWLAMDAVLAFWEAVGLEPARLYSQYLVTDAAEMLASAWGTGLGIPSELLGRMALVELPALAMLGAGSGSSPEVFTYEHAEAVQNALFNRSIEVPVKVLSGRLYVRISAQIYNDMQDYEVLRDAVLDLAGGAES